VKLVKGRPEKTENRLMKEIRVYDLLDERKISYERVDHEEAATMEVCTEIDAALGALICKNLFLCNRQKTQYYLLMMPGHKVFKTKDLSAQIQSARLSFADADAMLAYLDIMPGSVSVFGLMNDDTHQVQLLIDKEILEYDTVGCHPCVNTTSLKVKTKDLVENFLPAISHNPLFVELPSYETQ